MNEIESISLIKRKDLDECDYFRTLIDAGYSNQLLTDDNLLDLQVQMVELLDERVYRYNGIDSSSIRKEIMEEISVSNLYTIGIYLKKFRNPDDAIEFLKMNGLKQAYKEGRKQIDKMLDCIRVLYIRVKRNKVDIKNSIYNDTILGGIQGFLKKYDPDFKAQDMIITADYPLFNNLICKLDGIEFIKEYLNSLDLENQFCNEFSIEKIRYLLSEYSHDYKDLIINIFEIIFLETLSCKLVKRDIHDLVISISELDKIYMIFNNKESVEVKNIVIEAYKEIKKEILMNNIELQKYIEKNLNYIVELIQNSLKNSTLDKIFIIQKYIKY